jgi:hypothetical protein
VHEQLKLSTDELDQLETLLNADPEVGSLTAEQFDQLTERLIHVATAEGRLPSDALAALAKALGILSIFTAHREGLCAEQVVTASRESVATFARAAGVYMASNDAETEESGMP